MTRRCWLGIDIERSASRQWDLIVSSRLDSKNEDHGTLQHPRPAPCQVRIIPHEMVTAI